MQKLAGHAEDVLTVVLETALVEVLEVVERSVIVLGVADKGEVYPGHAVLHEDIQIRRVRHHAVDRYVG